MPADDQLSDDNQRVAEIEAVDASARTVDCQRGQPRLPLLASAAARSASVGRVWLQEPCGICRTPTFHVVSKNSKSVRYDAIVAFDPVDAPVTSRRVLEDWVAQEAGGLIAVASPHGGMAAEPASRQDSPLYPVEFERRLTALDDGLFGSQQPAHQFTPEGQEADFLAQPPRSRENWQRFLAFGYRRASPKPGARCISAQRPQRWAVAENPVYFASISGASRVLHGQRGNVASTRRRPGLFGSSTHSSFDMSQGRLLRGSSYGRLLVERDQYHVGDSAPVRPVVDRQSEPYVARSVRARPAARIA